VRFVFLSQCSPNHHQLTLLLAAEIFFVSEEESRTTESGFTKAHKTLFTTY
jgi:hypothetical protein